MVTQYIEVLQSYGNPNTLKYFNILKCFNLMKVTIRLQHFNILGYHRIAILQYITNYLCLQRTLTVWSIFLFLGSGSVEPPYRGTVSVFVLIRLSIFLFLCPPISLSLHGLDASTLLIEGIDVAYLGVNSSSNLLQIGPRRNYSMKY